MGAVVCRTHFYKIFTMAKSISPDQKAAAQEGTQSLMESDLEKVGHLTNVQPQFAANIPIQPQVKETPANVVLKLVETVRMGRVNLDGEDFVIDPATGNQRKARLLRGVNTIWQDEQDTGLKLTLDYVNRNKRSLEFENKTYIIQPHDKTAIQFAEVCNSNIDNDNKFGVKPIYFSIWNPLKEAQLAAQKTNNILKALQMASLMPKEKMERHAAYLGVPLYDEMGNKAIEEMVRNKYALKAYEDPKKFIDSAENPAVDILWAIKSMVANGRIDLGKQAGQAYFHDGGYITSIPDGEDAVKYLEKYALIEDEKSRNFKTTLLTVVK